MQRAGASVSASTTKVIKSNADIVAYLQSSTRLLLLKWVAKQVLDKLAVNEILAANATVSLLKPLDIINQSEKTNWFDINTVRKGFMNGLGQ